MEGSTTSSSLSRLFNSSPPSPPADELEKKQEEKEEQEESTPPVTQPRKSVVRRRSRSFQDLQSMFSGGSPSSETSPRPPPPPPPPEDERDTSIEEKIMQEMENESPKPKIITRKRSKSIQDIQSLFSGSSLIETQEDVFRKKRSQDTESHSGVFSASLQSLSVQRSAPDQPPPTSSPKKPVRRKSKTIEDIQSVFSGSSRIESQEEFYNKFKKNGTHSVEQRGHQSNVPHPPVVHKRRLSLQTMPTKGEQYLTAIQLKNKVESKTIDNISSENKVRLLQEWWEKQHKADEGVVGSMKNKKIQSEMALKFLESCGVQQNSCDENEWKQWNKAVQSFGETNYCPEDTALNHPQPSGDNIQIENDQEGQKNECLVDVNDKSTDDDAAKQNPSQNEQIYNNYMVESNIKDDGLKNAGEVDDEKEQTVGNESSSELIQLQTKEDAVSKKEDNETLENIVNTDIKPLATTDTTKVNPTVSTTKKVVHRRGSINGIPVDGIAPPPPPPGEKTQKEIEEEEEAVARRIRVEAELANFTKIPFQSSSSTSVNNNMENEEANSIKTVEKTTVLSDKKGNNKVYRRRGSINGAPVDGVAPPPPPSPLPTLNDEGNITNPLYIDNIEVASFGNESDNEGGEVVDMDKSINDIEDDEVLEKPAGCTGCIIS